MHAIRLHAFGPAENLRYEEVPDLVPGPGEVRIAVEAAGVHLIDTMIRRGVAMGPIPLPSLPAIPGREVAGRVDAVGDGVEATWVGRRAVAHFGPHGSGGYAEQATVAATRLHALEEDGLSAEDAVTAIGTGRTAQLILDAAAIGPDDVVLIPSAAGGLGPLLVQAARAAGAEVVAVAGGPEKVVLAQSFGPSVALDHRDPEWPARVPEGLTVVLDSVGGDFGALALERVVPGGRAVVIGGPAGPGSARDDIKLVPLAPPSNIRPLEQRALAAFATGALRPNLHPAFPLANAAAAHAALESRATAGKVVLKP
ncbi:zinc-binding dehydrogenase [Baekduia sp. Peel2402]|uniref:zinc-binding dehydrogenase n=1 Tax=Baekduia sp. Peel2402 TaxID=3458296 RepID=UPI00403EBCBB